MLTNFYKIFLSKRIKRTTAAAFTLVEAMVAISILSLAVTGPLVIAQKGIGSAIYARDEITAFYLAEEAVEYIRNVRDSNRISGTSWLSQFSGCKESGAGERCEIDARYPDFTTVGAIVSCYTDSTYASQPGGVCKPLSYDSSSKLYGYGSGGTWTTTKFTRTISVDDRASAKEAMISVTISWSTNLFSPVRSFTVKEYMFNF
jgi:type II secretory pathway pseudopilin PulG